MSGPVSHVVLDLPPAAIVFFRRLPAVIGFDGSLDPACGNTGRARCLRSRNSIGWSNLFRATTVEAAFEMREAPRDGTHAPMRGRIMVQRNRGRLEATNARAVLDIPRYVGHR
jgi:hypothetical protein